jgi:leucyl-tRNA synthetase
VIAPEHPMVASLTTDTQKNAVEEYAVQAAAKTDIQRTSLEKDKTGVFTGSYAVHPLTGKQIPIWVADYVLIGYGTGVVMAVPAHDERDFAFAKTYDLPIVAVVRPTEQTDDAPSNATTEESSAQKLPFVENGISINSPLINDLPTQQAKEAIIAHLESQQIGKRSITYRLRDWLVSRQRYWGAPIPIVYDPDGQPHPVAEDDLPVTLPYEVDFKPTGQSPLTYTDEFHQSAEQRYGAGWRREVDTMDTFVDSSWYFFRHLDADNDTSVFDTAKANAWLPTDLYMIGAEHIVLHLLYARFFTKFFHKIGLIEFREPFARMRHMGTILGPDGRKMSKRWGNVINPTDVINEFGADTVRVYEMFMGPLDQAKPWNPSNVQGSYRFLQRVWKIYQQADQYIVDEADASEPASGEKAGASDHAECGSEQAAADTAVTKKLYKTIQKVSHDIPEMKFNTAIAAMMEFLNEWEKKTNGTPPKLSRNDAASFLIILAPFAPFMTEELWHQVLGKTESIHTADWPEIADDAIVEDAINLPVQINGKTRGTVTIAPDATQEQTMEVVRQDAKLAKYLTDQPRKVIFVPGKILNVVV